MTDRPRSHGRKSIRLSAQPRDLMTARPELANSWTARVLTLYPDMFPGVLGQSLTGRALDEGLWSLDPVDIRQFATDRHRTVDDTPAGGGAGMVLKPDIVAAALDAADSGLPRADWPVIYLSPRGRRFDQQTAHRLAGAKGVTLLCGRFEGVDQRVLDARDVEEVSLGDFVLTGGEIAAQALIDATVRLIPRVLGNQASTEEESFSDGLLEHPHYTRPTEWEGRAIPEILLSGHHAKIAEWRHAQSENLTKERRPDLWRAYLERQGKDPVRDHELSDAQIIAAKGEQKDD
ncbi:tRNA (guanosine(37)-N1)-methyltransferase TrmD [Oceanomicrobium pacificus]|uniref:tRNA (guanine-N(1)-)-methyltransferase n=1 Tax=Oceanomicrobium pacificus TaxID=2692916 RepID=A0A6B0TVV7_9RHOB|nr:tRNA (guanosine(37)-N1)-methyltransferase TrmD [Oceanomicrobium pacificus]MXU66829.1 tRNA (guanosine(37)-N1)-methyltransferase TrmD [Oceanomicrobium pacificus]